MRLNAATVCAFVAVSLWPAANAAAQTVETVRARVRTEMSLQAHGWQIEKDMSRENSFLQTWLRDAEKIAIDYTQCESVEDAAKRLVETTNGVSAPGGGAWPGVGDQAFIFARADPSGQATIYFRRGSGNAFVNAPSVEIATYVSQLVARQMY